MTCPRHVQAGSALRPARRRCGCAAAAMSGTRPWHVRDMSCRPPPSSSSTRTCLGHAHDKSETCPAGGAAAQLLRSLRGLASRGGVREATARYGEIWGVWGDMGDMGGVREATASASKTGNAGGTAISFVGVLEMTVEDCAAAAAAAAADAGAAADGGPCQQRLERHLASATAARSPSLVLVRGAERCDGDGCFDAALEILERRDIARGCPRLADIAGGTGDRSKRVRPRTATD